MTVSYHQRPSVIPHAYYIYKIYKLTRTYLVKDFQLALLAVLVHAPHAGPRTLSPRAAEGVRRPGANEPGSILGEAGDTKRLHVPRLR